jgi:hypothetical protein
MEWFRLYPVRLLTDIRKHGLTLEEQGFVLQLCTHVALFDGALALTPDSLRDEMRPAMTRKRFDQLWERTEPVTREYLADLTSQVEKHGHVSSVRRDSANARWKSGASPKPDANVDANADADKKREEKKRSPQPPQGADPLFDRFWKAYPRHTGKVNAEKAFAKLKVDADLLDTMLAALTWQRRQRDWTKDDGAFIPHPATWLNQRRWEDEHPDGALNGTLLDDERPVPPLSAWSAND